MKIYFSVTFVLLLARIRNVVPTSIDNTTLLKFKHYIDLLNTYDHKLNKTLKFMVTVDQCYKLASTDSNLDQFALAITNLIYAVKKRELFQGIPPEILQSKSEKELEKILVSKMTPEMEKLILKFLGLLGPLDNVHDIISSMLQKSKVYLSDMNADKLTEEGKSHRRCCFFVLDYVESNKELFQLYFDGLMVLKKKMPTVNASLFLKEIGSYATKKKKLGKEIGKIIERIQQLEIEELKTDSNECESSDQEQNSNVGTPDSIPTGTPTVPVPITTEGEKHPQESVTDGESTFSQEEQQKSKIEESVNPLATSSSKEQEKSEIEESANPFDTSSPKEQEKSEIEESANPSETFSPEKTEKSEIEESAGHIDEANDNERTRAPTTDDSHQRGSKSSNETHSMIDNIEPDKLIAVDLDTILENSLMELDHETNDDTSELKTNDNVANSGLRLSDRFTEMCRLIPQMFTGCFMVFYSAVIAARSYFSERVAEKSDRSFGDHLNQMSRSL